MHCAEKINKLVQILGLRELLAQCFISIYLYYFSHSFCIIIKYLKIYIIEW